MIEICPCLQFCYSYILLVIKTVCFLITICWIISPNKKYFARLITISPLHIAWHIKERQSNGIVGTTVQHPSVKWPEHSINHQDNFVCCNVILRVFFNQGSCCSTFFIPNTEAQCSPCRTFSSQHTGGYCHWGSCHCTASSLSAQEEWTESWCYTFYSLRYFNRLIREHFVNIRLPVRIIYIMTSVCHRRAPTSYKNRQQALKRNDWKEMWRSTLSVAAIHRLTYRHLWTNTPLKIALILFLISSWFSWRCNETQSGNIHSNTVFKH